MITYKQYMVKMYTNLKLKSYKVIEISLELRVLTLN